VLRLEHGRLPSVSHADLALLAAVVGLRLHAQFFPRGSPVRDAAQLPLLDRLRRRIHEAWGVNLEWVLRGHGDLRAFDALLTLGAARVAVEAISRLRDVQAQLRVAQAKARDAGIECLILLIADTNANRRAMSEHRALLARAFPLDTRAILRALAEGRSPGTSGIVVL
jgi:hypothetical protein